MLQINTVNYMCLSMIMPLVLYSKLQVKTEGVWVTTNSNNQHFTIILKSRRLCCHRRPLSVISHHSNPWVYHQNTLFKYGLDQNAETCVWTVDYFTDILIKVGKKETHYIITKYRVGCGELTAMVAVTKNHLYFQNNWWSVQQGLFLVK